MNLNPLRQLSRHLSRAFARAGTRYRGTIRVAFVALALVALAPPPLESAAPPACVRASAHGMYFPSSECGTPR